MSKTYIDWRDLTRQYYTKAGERFHITPSDLAGATLLHAMIQERSGHIAEAEIEGHVAEVEDDDTGLRYVQKVEKLGGRIIHKLFDSNFQYTTFLFDHGVVRLEFINNYLKTHVISTDEQFASALIEDIRKDFQPVERQGHIFAIVRHGPHLGISSIGDASVPLIPSNYTPEVMEDYQYAVKDLKTSSPSGRIVIMEGEPGTGKTHLIRALLSEVPDAMFVLISPEMVPSLAGPDLLPLLLQNKQNYAMKGPIALVLEDADRCLVSRGDNNLSSIQSLLNLGDGILGSLLDLRIIATTNAKKLEMEAAILRPGRLSKRMEVGALDLVTARGVFQRLLPTVKLPKEFRDPPMTGFRMTLAEAYSLARKHGWEPQVREVNEDVASGSSMGHDYDD